MTRKICPECKSNLFHKDLIRDEICCRNCGLVLQAPYIYGLIFPSFKLVPPKKKIVISTDFFNHLQIEISYNLKLN